MTARLWLALALGVAVLAAVLLRFDMRVVLASMARVGFGGFALIVAAGLLAEIVLAVGIYPFLPHSLSLWIIAASRQLRDSSADVLPITQLGGVVLAARALVLAGIEAPLASAAVIADLTTETFAQGLYVLVGVLASLSLLYKSAALSPYVGAMLGGALFLSAGAMGFAIVQILGSRFVERFAALLFSAKITEARDFHIAIRRIYASRGKLLLSMLLQFAGWIGSGLWLWVVLMAMDSAMSSGPPSPSRRWSRACAARWCSCPLRWACKRPAMRCWLPCSACRPRSGSPSRSSAAPATS